MGWHVQISKQAVKEARRLESAGRRPQIDALLRKIALDPFTPGDSFEKLVGDFAGLYSRRIDYKNRMVYQVIKSTHTVRVLRLAGHYD